MKFFEKINKMETPLSRLIKKKEKRHITDIRNERQNIITEIKGVTREYDKQLHTHKFDNLDEMDEFLEKYKLLKLTEE